MAVYCCCVAASLALLDDTAGEEEDDAPFGVEDALDGALARTSADGG